MSSEREGGLKVVWWFEVKVEAEAETEMLMGRWEGETVANAGKVVMEGR